LSDVYEPIIIDPVKLTNQYLNQTDWRRRESSSATFSVGALSNYMSAAITSAYWLSEIYTPDISAAHRSCDMHIHDLGAGGPQAYCSGWSLRQLLEEGLNGVQHKINSNPANHLNSAVQQIINFLGIMANCWSGETKILFADGSSKSFEECEKEGIVSGTVMTYDPLLNKFYAEEAYNIGKKAENVELLELLLESGETVRVEPWHEIPTLTRGYVRADELTKWDVIPDMKMTPVQSFLLTIYGKIRNYLFKMWKTFRADHSDI
jgi:hypothetical protein